MQPGPADGGRAPDDRVGTLAGLVPLEAGVTQTVDAAVALLDDPEVDPEYPVGRITTTAVALGGEVVGKSGRTTGVTAGRVTAIELDDVVVGYGDGLGALRFDDQIEVESTGDGPFSRGGDSGSLVYRETAWRWGCCSRGRRPAARTARGSRTATRSGPCSIGWARRCSASRRDAARAVRTGLLARPLGGGTLGPAFRPP